MPIERYDQVISSWALLQFVLVFVVIAGFSKAAIYLIKKQSGSDPIKAIVKDGNIAASIFMTAVILIIAGIVMRLGISRLIML